MKGLPKYLLITLMVILFICPVICPVIYPVIYPAMAFDKEAKNLDKFGFEPDKYIDLSESVVSVITLGTGIGMVREVDEFHNIKYRAVQGTFIGQGSGVVVRGLNGNIYILTNAHVIIPDTLTIAEGTSSSIVTYLLKVIHQVVFVGAWDSPFKVKCSVVWISSDPTRAVDTAILKPIYDNIFLKPIPYKTIGFGVIQGLEKDDAVVVVTGYRDKDPTKDCPAARIFPGREWWYEQRGGKIIATEPKVFDESILPWFGISDVTTDIKIYPGDSGSPAFIFINGEPHLVGLMRAMSYSFDPYNSQVTGYYSYFTFLDEVVLRYLATPGLD